MIFSRKPMKIERFILWFKIFTVLAANAQTAITKSTLKTADPTFELND